MGAADDRHHVVFAMAFDADVAKDDHFVIALDLFEGAGEDGGGIFRVAAEKFLVGADDAGGGVDQAFAFRVFAAPAEQGADLASWGFFGAGMWGGRSPLWRA
jgi:hypothetical protein